MVLIRYFFVIHAVARIAYLMREKRFLSIFSYPFDYQVINGNMSCQRLLSSDVGFTNRSYSTNLRTKGLRNMECS